MLNMIVRDEKKDDSWWLYEDWEIKFDPRMSGIFPLATTLLFNSLSQWLFFDGPKPLSSPPISLPPSRFLHEIWVKKKFEEVNQRKNRMC